MSPRIHQPADDLYFVERGWLNANMAVFKGQTTTLMDTGYLESLDETLELLEQCGVSPEDVDLILTSHIHCDHVGGHDYIHKLSGCRIALHPQARWAIENKNGLATWHEHYGQAYKYFPTHQNLEDGDRLNINGLELTVLFTPGHGAGHVSFFAPDTGWLFSADAVWDGDFGVLTTLVEGWQAPWLLAESLRRLRELPVTQVFPGHGPPIADGKGAMDRCLKRIEAFIAQPQRMGQDQMRKILLYQLLMKGPVSKVEFWELVRGQPWFVQSCGHYFGGRLQDTFDRYLGELLDRGLVREKDGRLSSSLPA